MPSLKKDISRTSGKDEFYDLAEDPWELYNRIDCEAYRETIGKMQLAMLKWLQATDEKEQSVKQMIAENTDIAQLMQYCRGLGKEEKEAAVQNPRRPADKSR